MFPMPPGESPMGPDQGMGMPAGPAAPPPGGPPQMPSPATMKRELTQQLRMAYSELKRAAYEAGIDWKEIVTAGGVK